MGCFDRLEEETEKPKQANFYPADITKEEFDKWVETLSPSDQFAARGFYTMIRRNEKGELYMIPYNEFFKDDLEKMASLLRKAAGCLVGIDGYEPLVKFLNSRADSFLSNDYIDSEVDWLGVKGDSNIEVTIGPYENYEW